MFGIEFQVATFDPRGWRYKFSNSLLEQIAWQEQIEHSGFEINPNLIAVAHGTDCATSSRLGGHVTDGWAMRRAGETSIGHEGAAITKPSAHQRRAFRAFQGRLWFLRCGSPRRFQV